MSCCTHCNGVFIPLEDYYYCYYYYYQLWYWCFARVAPPFLFTFNLLSQAFVQPCCLSCGTFVQVRHSFFVFSMLEEFTLLSFHFLQSVQESYLHDLTQARSPFVDLLSYPHQTIQPASIKPLVPSFLKISLPLPSFFPMSAGVSLPSVVSSRSSCPSHSSFFSCSSRYSVLTSGSVQKMDNFLAF